MMNLGTILRPVEAAGLFAVSDQLVIGATHHDAVLLDQAVWDALGTESWAVRRQAAFDASFALIGAISKRLSVHGEREIIDLATELFATLGMGLLRFDISATGGEVIGTDLLFGAGILERYGDHARVRHFADPFAAGYAAAAASLAFPSDWGSFEADETRCVARSDNLVPGSTMCVFSLTRRPLTFRPGEGLSRSDAEQLLGPDAPPESELLPVGLTTREILSACVANERGIIQLPDVRFALMPASYRAQLTYDTLHLMEKRSGAMGNAAPAQLSSLFLDLVRHATRTGMFQLIASLYESAPLRDAFGAPPDDPAERLEQLGSVATALGWGAITISEYVHRERLVLTLPVSPEAVYYAARHGGTPQSRMPGLQGLAEALALLSDWAELGQEQPAGLRYQELCVRGPRFKVEESRSILSGDRECELSVSTI